MPRLNPIPTFPLPVNLSLTLRKAFLAVPTPHSLFASSIGNRNRI